MSSFKKAFTLLTLAMWVFTTSATLSADESTRLARAKYFFGASSAPSKSILAVNISEQVPEGEATNGFPTLLEIDHSPVVVKRLSTSEAQDTDTLPRWSSNGSALYFSTLTGIHIMDGVTLKSSILRKGSLAGLAISADDSKLAFWDLAPDPDHNYALIVIDLNSTKNVRSWSLPNSYDADQYGFEIEFATDGQSLFARTYDTEGRTPLKKFDLASGSVAVVSENCSGLASSKDAVYFVESTNRGQSLRKIDRNGNQPQDVASDFSYDDLMASGPKRWLVTRELRSGKFALVDTSDDKIQVVPGHCDSLTVLANGKIVYFKGGVVGTSGSVCSVSKKH